MKTTINFLVISVFIIIMGNLQAQVSSLFNNGVTTDYVGWNNLQAFPLQIRHNANQPIDFYTNNSASPRMRIANTGWVGVGSSNPSSVLHLNKANTGEMFRTVGADTSENRWRLFTNGNSVVEKFRLFVPKDSSNVFLQAQQANGNLSFNTAGGSNGSFPDTKLRVFPELGIS
jgi:hypothetical protein